MNQQRIRQAMEEGRVAIGTHCSTQDIGFYEMCGHIGYDYVWIDNEHAGIDNITVRNGIVGANAGGCAAFVRVRWNEPSLAKPVLENGPDGIIFPMVNTPEEAERAVKACMYPPHGNRGFGPLRAIQYGTITDISLDDYAAEANKNTMKIIQAEHIDCVRNLDEILEVPGIDLIICGPMDLSASINKLGRFTDPEMRELFLQIINKCKARGIKYGLSIGYDPDLVQFWIDNGASFVSMGTAYDYFNLMSQQVLRRFRAK